MPFLNLASTSINLALASASTQVFGLGIGLKNVASFNISGSRSSVNLMRMRNSHCLRHTRLQGCPSSWVTPDKSPDPGAYSSSSEPPYPGAHEVSAERL